MKTKLWIFVAFAAMVTTGCKKEKVYMEGGPVFRETYITRYMLTDTLECAWGSSYLYSRTLEAPYIVASPSGKEYIDRSNPRFQELTDHYGDHFNSGLSMGHRAFAMLDEFNHIDIVSDQAFDAAHPAGTSLRDIAHVSFRSLYGFIKSGYDYDYLGVKTKPMTALTPDDLKLLAGPVGITFPASIPAGKHVFTVTFRSAGKTLVSTLAVEIG